MARMSHNCPFPWHVMAGPQRLSSAVWPWDVLLIHSTPLHSAYFHSVFHIALVSLFGFHVNAFSAVWAPPNYCQVTVKQQATLKAPQSLQLKKQTNPTWLHLFPWFGVSLVMLSALSQWTHQALRAIPCLENLELWSRAQAEPQSVSSTHHLKNPH